MGKDTWARRFFRHSPDSLTEAELLELLLRFSSQTPDLAAQALLDRFTGLAAILEATPQELESVEGVSQEDAFLLRLVAALHRRYFLSRSSVDVRLTDSNAFGAYLLPYFHGCKNEMVYLLCMDAAGKVLRCVCLGQGDINSANVPTRRMVEETLRANASLVVLAHNHPSGIALPSREDIELTLRLRDALEIMGISLADHILVADDDFVSLRESGYLRRF